MFFQQNHRRIKAGNEALFRSEMRQLEDMFSKLSPFAHNYPASSNTPLEINGGYIAYNIPANNNGPKPRKNNGFYEQSRRKVNGRTSFAEQGDSLRRTVHVSDIDPLITEEQLAALFLGCGQLVDCRVCGELNSILHFAFVEFTHQEGARAALGLSGTVLGFYAIKVLPSKTAIAPVNPSFLPRTLDERDMCARTVYVTNIHKKVSQTDLKLFFEGTCGKVGRLRLLGDYHHFTRIAFVEFVVAESAGAALNCSGVILGSLPIRVSPSKTPIRPRAPRLPFPTH